MSPLTDWLSLSRRGALQALSAMAGLSIAPAFFCKGVRAGNDEISFETFYALSLLVTERAALDPEFAHGLYDVFVREPWASKHIALSYEKLSGASDLQSAEQTSNKMSAGLSLTCA